MIWGIQPSDTVTGCRPFLRTMSRTTSCRTRNFYRWHSNSPHGPSDDCILIPQNLASSSNFNNVICASLTSLLERIGEGTICHVGLSGMLQRESLHLTNAPSVMPCSSDARDVRRSIGSYGHACMCAYIRLLGLTLNCVIPAKQRYRLIWNHNTSIDQRRP